MKRVKSIPILAVVLLIMLYGSSAACAAKQGKTETFDASKTYQGALAINLPSTDGTLEKIRRYAAAEGEEFGPVEYYEPGEKDFEPIIQKLLSRANINVLWIAGGIMDIPSIQKAVIKAGYKGQTRLMPVSGATPYHEPQ